MMGIQSWILRLSKSSPAYSNVMSVLFDVEIVLPEVAYSSFSLLNSDAESAGATMYSSIGE